MNLTNLENKKAVWDLWQRLNHVPIEDIEKTLAMHMAADVAWYGPHPINELPGRKQVADGFWRPLRESGAAMRGLGTA